MTMSVQEMFRDMLRHPELISSGPEIGLLMLLVELRGTPLRGDLLKSLDARLHNFHEWTPDLVSDIKAVLEISAASPVYRKLFTDKLIGFIKFVQCHGLPRGCQRSVALNEICIVKVAASD
jgi:hypothetical protein